MGMLPWRLHLVRVVWDTINPVSYTHLIIGDADQTEIGSAIPDFTYGITLTAAWKGLDKMLSLENTILLLRLYL